MTTESEINDFWQKRVKSKSVKFSTKARKLYRLPAGMLRSGLMILVVRITACWPPDSIARWRVETVAKSKVYSRYWHCSFRSSTYPVAFTCLSSCVTTLTFLCLHNGKSFFHQSFSFYPYPFTIILDFDVVFLLLFSHFYLVFPPFSFLFLLFLCRIYNL